MYDKLWQLLIDARTKNKFSMKKGYFEKKKKEQLLKENQPLRQAGKEIMREQEPNIKMLTPTQKPMVTKKSSTLSTKPRLSVDRIGIVR